MGEYQLVTLVSKEFTVDTGSWRWTVLFCITWEKTDREIRKETNKILVNQCQIQTLGNSWDNTEIAVKILELASVRVKLEVNVEKIKVIKLLNNETYISDMGKWTFEIGVLIGKTERRASTLSTFF